MWPIWPAIEKIVGDPDLPGQNGFTFGGGKMRGAVATSSASNHASELKSTDDPGGAGTRMPTVPPPESKRRLVHRVVLAGPTATATRCSVGVSEPLASHAPAPRAWPDSARRWRRENDMTRAAPSRTKTHAGAHRKARAGTWRSYKPENNGAWWVPWWLQ